jgi:magnesium transporter
MAFGPEGFIEQTIDDPASIRELLTRWPVTWINVEGLGDVDTIARLAEILGLHRLAVEDAVNTHQRAKVEVYREHLFIVSHMATFDGQLDTEQLSLFLGRNYVVTLQHGRPGDPFNMVRDRIRNAGGQMRELGADYLAYALLDAVIDGYFPVLETIGERLEGMEDEILTHPSGRIASCVHQTKRDLMTLRRATWPLREALNSLLREPNPLIHEETRLYLRDCYDHAVRIIDFVETYRELGSDLMDLYLSSINQRMTEVMKVLTIIATIFIPLTFISSIYGMNFDVSRSPWNMPELVWYFGYPFALGMMGIVAVGMLFYFRRKGWIGANGEPSQEPETPRPEEQHPEELPSSKSSAGN